MEAIAPKERTWEGGSTSPKQDVHACQGGENVQNIADAKGSVEGTSAMIEMVRLLQEKPDLHVHYVMSVKCSYA